ncbi:probable G-protein coupled receptor 139 [Heptranchias perlo]|uniref:probable G-protein coupled receptor 139 n=1 Tax=Heptranchias perlo TaxID=212740 RepID=UPI00355A5E0F
MILKEAAVLGDSDNVRKHVKEKLNLNHPWRGLSEIEGTDRGLHEQGVNLVAIVILSRGKCGLSRCISRYLVGMAVADLLVVITDSILRWVRWMYFPVSFLNVTPVCRLITFLVFAITEVSVWFTVAFTFDRFVAICCEKLKTKYCTEKTAAVVLGTVSVLSCLESLPWYFAYEPVIIIDSVPWFCVLKPSFHDSTAWAAYNMFHRILTPCVPFLLILLLNVLTIRRILVSGRIRRGLRGRSNEENHKDPEMENRKKSIILLFSITGSFILLWVTLVVINVYRRITNIDSYPSTSPFLITKRTAGMLQLLSSCTNTCIYVLTQNKFREELKNGNTYTGPDSTCTGPGNSHTDAGNPYTDPDSPYTGLVSSITYPDSFYTDSGSSYTDTWSSYTDTGSSYGDTSTDRDGSNTDPDSSYTDLDSSYAEPGSSYTDP